MSDFDELTKANVLKKLAELAGFAFVPLGSTLQIIAGSVKVIAQFPAASATEAITTQSNLELLGSEAFEAEMNDVLAATGSYIEGSVEVEVEANDTRGQGSASTGSSAIAVAAAAAGAIIVAALLGGAFIYIKKKRTRAAVPNVTAAKEQDSTSNSVVETL